MPGVLAVVEANGEFECRCHYNDRAIPAACEFQWDRGRKGWFTRIAGNVDVAVQMAEARGLAVKRAKLPEVAIPKWAGHPSLAKDGPEFPRPPGLDYFPFQKGGIAYAMGRKHTLIADSPGLGKTIQAIGVLNADPVQSVLVLCPAAIKHQWERMLDTWLNYYLSIGIVEKGRWPKTDLVIVNYDILKKYHSELRAKTWDVVIADEVHLIKNPERKRTIAVYGGAEGLGPIPCSRFLALTGTPVDNRPIDLFATLRYMMPERFPSWWEYTLLYCDGKFGRFDYQFSGASNMKTLGAILRERCMVRRLTRHVVTQLPRKRRETVLLEATPAARKAVRAELAAYEEAKLSRRNFDVAGDRLGSEEAGKQGLGQLARLRMETALAKIDPAVEVMREWIEGEKLLVVCYHRKVIEGLAKKFGKAAITYHGGTQDRDGAIQQFIKDPEKRVFIMQIIAGGTGVDGLQTACSHGVFFEFDWRDGQMVQAEDRLWRIGQNASVLWSYFVLPESMDQKLLETRAAKAWMSAGILDAPAMEVEGEGRPVKEGELL